MKKIIIVLFITSLQSSFAQKRELANNENITIIKNVNIYTGYEYIENTNLIYQNGIIRDLNKTIKTPSNAKIIDGKNKTIIPPLVNAHVHIWSAKNLKVSLKFGVFANLDMHSTDQYANLLRAYNDSTLYATYYSANAGATVPNGHGTQFGIKVPTLNDTVTASKFVNDRINAGADYIKILKEPLRTTLNKKQTLEIINETHKHNKLAVAHISTIKDAIELSNQGVNGFVHSWWDKPATDKQINILKHNNTFIVPTLTVTVKLIELIESGKFPLFNKGTAAPYLSKQELFAEVNKAYKKGIPILSGTDAPNFQMNYTDQLFKEMLALSKAGLSNEDVIKSATTNIYEAFNLNQFKGIKIGEKATFIIIEGNPILNIKDISNSKMIVKNGVHIKNTH